jgi:hypothetical protein
MLTLAGMLVADIRTRAPARLKLSEWVERNIKLPESTALPGPRAAMAPDQVGIARRAHRGRRGGARGAAVTLSTAEAFGLLHQRVARLDNRLCLPG